MIEKSLLPLKFFCMYNVCYLPFLEILLDASPLFFFLLASSDIELCFGIWFFFFTDSGLHIYRGLKAKMACPQKDKMGKLFL